MQIFVPFEDQCLNARALDDKRVVKMCTETTQILSTVMWLQGSKGPYRITHKHHPCVKWAATSSENFYWLVVQLIALKNEYMHRYHKVHACSKFIDTFLLHYETFQFASELRTPFANATTFFRHIDDVHLAYQKQLIRKWHNDKRPARWYRKALRCSFTQWFKEVGHAG